MKLEYALIWTTVLLGGCALIRWISVRTLNKRLNEAERKLDALESQIRETPIHRNAGITVDGYESVRIENLMNYSQRLERCLSCPLYLKRILSDTEKQIGWDTKEQ